MEVERFVIEFANYRKGRLMDLIYEYPSLDTESYREKVQELIDRIDKYVLARKRGIITVDEAMQCIAECR